MTYVIEGKITELSLDESYFTLCGSEGFSFKRNDKKYNILCPKDMPKEEESLVAIVLAQDFKFPSGDNKDLLLQAVSYEKRIKVQLSVEDENVKTHIDLKKLIETEEKNSSEGSDKKKIVISLISN